MPEYTLLAALSVPAVVALEVLWLRTGIFRRLQYWLAMAIVLGFQVPVDGWLTKLSDPIVLYDDAQTLGVRAPWDIPVEDFAFGFSMVTLALLVWVHLGRDEDRAAVTETREEPVR
ncbi:lycopene cyclase domain-containing protein [Nocardioides marmoraquaticus]